MWTYIYKLGMNGETSALTTFTSFETFACFLFAITLSTQAPIFMRHAFIVCAISRLFNPVLVLRDLMCLISVWTARSHSLGVSATSLGVGFGLNRLFCFFFLKKKKRAQSKTDHIRSYQVDRSKDDDKSKACYHHYLFVDSAAFWTSALALFRAPRASSLLEIRCFFCLSTSWLLAFSAAFRFLWSVLSSLRSVVHTYKSKARMKLRSWLRRILSLTHTPLILCFD